MFKGLIVNMKRPVSIEQRLTIVVYVGRSVGWNGSFDYQCLLELTKGREVGQL